jgi:TrmH family RNA methyltransferase
VAEIIQIHSANARFQHVEALRRNRTKRQHHHEFFVESVRAINQAIGAGWDITGLWYAADRPLSPWAQDVLAAGGAEQLIAMPAELFDQLSERSEGSELIATVAMADDEDRLAAIPRHQNTLAVVLDRPANPGNLGTVIRSVDGLGGDGVVVTGHAADVYDPVSVRASLGALFVTPVARITAPQRLLEWAHAAPRLTLIGASGGDGPPPEAVDLTGPVALVIGSEREGLSASYREACDQMVHIPMQGRAADSLNMAVAAGILLAEAQRQRRAP